MSPRHSKSSKRRNTQNQTRNIEPEIQSDSFARNLLVNKPKLTPKATAKKPSKEKVRKEQAKIRLYGARSGKNYREDQLDIPKLNKAITPGIKVKRGKKEKKFVADNDTLTLTRIAKSISEKNDEVNESKLEKAKRLEEIRELKRQEIERKEEEKIRKLEDKKDEVRSKSSLSRSARRKNSKAKKREESEEFTEEKPKKSVSFA